MVLLVLVVLGGTLWYYWHVDPLVRPVTLVGTPLTIWAVYGLLQKWLPDSWLAKNPSHVSRGLLVHPRARNFLLMAILLVGLLLVTTTSVYVTYDKTTGQGDYDVEVYRDGVLLMEPQHLTSYQPIRGKTFFFDLSWLINPWQLTFQVTDPPYQYDVKTLTVSAPLSYRVSLPSEIRTKRYRVFRVLPADGKWLSLTVRADNPNDTRYRLQVSRREKGGERSLLTVPFFFEPVYFGGSRDLINHLKTAEDTAGTRRWNITGHLKTLQQDAFERKAGFLLATETICPTEQIDDPKAEFVVRLLKQDLDSLQWVQAHEFDFVIPETDDDLVIHNIYVRD
jgi:hypothetical protein